MCTPPSPGKIDKLYSLRIDGSGHEEMALPGNHEPGMYPASWSPDGKHLAYGESTGCFILSVEGGDKPSDSEIFIDLSHAPTTSISSFMFRPTDGRCIAYVSDVTGRNEIYIKEFSLGNLSGGWVQTVSSEGGTEPCWSRDGSKLFYRGTKDMMAVSIESQADGTIEVGESQVLFDGRDYQSAFYGFTNYDVASDGRFIMVKDSPPTRINVVLNWSEELKQLAPARGQ